MTSQQDTELSRILDDFAEELIVIRATAREDYYYETHGMSDDIDEAYEKAIQALTSWKDKEVKGAELKARLVELDLLEQIINRWHDNKMMSKTHIAYLDEYKMKRLKDLTDRLESLQSQGGKNE